MTIDERLLRIETWRTRFIAQGIDAFALEYPAADKRELKRLVQQAQAISHRHGTARRLLRYLRALDDAR
ncbi:ribosomal 50S subunit-associated protein YjgA (DUF615 family) [Lysobacter enzymogenes]|uniref:dual-action ribosomal maturation protein DarP n=1 Tax=Lysobacter enzymogenes TaxID=69 RepID=UPI003393DEF2